jgi:hypothetical protein
MFNPIPFNSNVLLSIDATGPIVTVTGRADFMRRTFQLRDCIYLESDGLIRAEVAHDPLDM